MLKKIIPYILIPVGIFLEIYFYTWRFLNDGIDLWLSIVIGTGLTILLTALIAYRHIKYAVPIAVVVAFYSVFATSAGQAFTLTETINVQSIDTARENRREEMIIDYQNQIDILQSEYDTIQTQKTETVKTLADRYYWKNTLKKAEDRQDEILSEKKALQDQIDQLRAVQTTHKEIKKVTTNIYQFYNKITRLSAEWLQFILQTLVSVFIAVMAPIGMIMLDIKQLPLKIKITPDMIKNWVSISWINIKNKRSDLIFSENDFFEIAKRRNFNINPQAYKKIKNAAIQKKLLDKNKILVYDITQAVEILTTFFGGKK